MKPVNDKQGHSMHKQSKQKDVDRKQNSKITEESKGLVVTTSSHSLKKNSTEINDHNELPNSHVNKPIYFTIPIRQNDIKGNAAKPKTLSPINPNSMKKKSKKIENKPEQQIVTVLNLNPLQETALGSKISKTIGVVELEEQKSKNMHGKFKSEKKNIESKLKSPSKEYLKVELEKFQKENLSSGQQNLELEFGEQKYQKNSLKLKPQEKDGAENNRIVRENENQIDKNHIIKGIGDAQNKVVQKYAAHIYRPDYESEQIVKLPQKYQHEQESKRKYNGELKELQDKHATSKMKYKRLLFEKDKELQEANNIISTTKDSLNKTVLRVNDIQLQLNKEKNKKMQLKNQNQKLKDQYMQLQKLHESCSEKKEMNQKLKEDKSYLEEQLKRLNDEKEDSSLKNEELKLVCSRLQGNLNEVNQMFDSLKLEFSNSNIKYKELEYENTNLKNLNTSFQKNNYDITTELQNKHTEIEKLKNRNDAAIRDKENSDTENKRLILLLDQGINTVIEHQLNQQIIDLEEKNKKLQGLLEGQKNSLNAHKNEDKRLSKIYFNENERRIGLLVEENRQLKLKIRELSFN